jgi:ABC-type multidrug transport system ATPase subunit
VVSAGDDGGMLAVTLPVPTGSLSVEGVTYVPPGTSAIVLQGVSLSASPGECVGIIGPSGAGKSTLARLMMGVNPPTMGRVRVDGADIALWMRAGGARRLGYLPQEVELFEGTIRDNIARLGEADIDSVVEAARLVGLHDAVMQLPLGYDTPIGGHGVRLSGGQRQCLGLARAFFDSPQLVVLDEPNANLDETGEQALYRAVEKMKAVGTTIIVITHRFGILNVTDKIAVMRGGVISAFGTSEEIYDRFFRQPTQHAPPTPATPAKIVAERDELQANEPEGEAETSLEPEAEVETAPEPETATEPEAEAETVPEPETKACAETAPEPDADAAQPAPEASDRAATETAGPAQQTPRDAVAAAVTRKRSGLPRAVPLSVRPVCLNGEV